MASAARADVMTPKQAVAKCEAQHPRVSPGGDMLELLVLSGSEIDAAARARYENLAADAVVWACSTGARLEIRPIDGLSDEEAAAYTGEAPPVAASANPFVDRDKRHRFFDATLPAIASLYTMKGTPRADYFGGIGLAVKASRAFAPPARLTILIVGHGWQQVPDLYDSRTHSADYVRSFIAQRRAHGEMPDLHGARVLIVGVSSGPPSMRKKGDLGELCDRFWRLVIAAAHGTWGDCWPDLPASFLENL
jgi:hypothetical protein